LIKVSQSLKGEKILVKNANKRKNFLQKVWLELKEVGRSLLKLEKIG